jgi:CheY-like chemotaxis protein
MASKHILVLECDKSIIEVIECILLDEGYYVTSSIQEIKFTDLDQLPDLILLDHWLSHRSGVDICKEIRRNPRTAFIPVILTSTDDITEDFRASCQANGYISKPFDIQCLLDQVNRFV